MATETGDSPADAADGATETVDETATETVDESAETEAGISPYMRGVTVTTLATLLGMAAAVLSTLFATANGEPDSFRGGLFMVAAIIVQFPIYRLIGIDVDDFGAKDQLYIIFMTFVLWFVTWSLLLTTGGLQ